MNIFGMILIIIIGLCLWGGFRRGLFRSLLVAAAMILSMVGAAYATPVVGQWIQEHRNIYNGEAAAGSPAGGWQNCTDTDDRGTAISGRNEDGSYK